MTKKDAVLTEVQAEASASAIHREVRDQRIVVARSEGATLREIAKAANLTPAGVDKIVKRLNGR